VESISRSIVVNSSADYITNVKVDATVLEKLSYWFGTQWKLLAGIAAVVGAAFLALLAFSSQAKEGFFKLFKPKNAGTAAAPPATPPEKQSKKSKKSKKSRKTP
jgi:cytoskeletal protein RodZ